MPTPLQTAVASHHDLAMQQIPTQVAEHRQLPVDRQMDAPPRSLLVWGWQAGADRPVITGQLRPIGPGGVVTAIGVAARLLLGGAGCAFALLSTTLLSSDDDQVNTDARLLADFAHPAGRVGSALWTYGVNTAGDVERCGTWMTKTGAYDLGRRPRYTLGGDAIRSKLLHAGLSVDAPLGQQLAGVFAEPLTYPQQQALSVLGAAQLLGVRFRGNVQVGAPHWSGGPEPDGSWVRAVSENLEVRRRLVAALEDYT